MGKVVYIDDRQNGIHCYWPEMKGRKPDANMEAKLSYNGRHYYIDTSEDLKGRGITFIKRYESRDFCEKNYYKVGWNCYQVTRRAFEKLKAEYSISMECFLD